MVIYMPMIPEAVVAMLACARIGAVHSVVFGGFAPHELAVRIDDARPKVARRRLLRHRAEPGRASTSRCSTGRWSWPSTSRTRCVVKQRPQAEATMVEAAGRRLGHRRCKAGAHRPGRRASRSRRPTRSTSSTPRAPPASPRASSATTAATRSRMAWSLPNIYDVHPGRGVVDRVRRRLGRRPLLHRLRAAASPAPPRCSTRASRSAPRTPARSGG